MATLSHMLSTCPSLPPVGDPPGESAWVSSCASRLAELRPADDLTFLLAVAQSLFVDLHGFDPLIAAEMEHESGVLDR